MTKNEMRKYLRFNSFSIVIGGNYRKEKILLHLGQEERRRVRKLKLSEKI